MCMCHLATMCMCHLATGPPGAVVLDVSAEVLTALFKVSGPKRVALGGSGLVCSSEKIPAEGGRGQ